MFPIHHTGATWHRERFSSYQSGRCTRGDTPRSCPACSHWRSARQVGSRTGTEPSETCGSNNTPSFSRAWLLHAPRHRGPAPVLSVARLDADLKPTAPIQLAPAPPLQHLNLLSGRPWRLSSLFCLPPHFSSAGCALGGCQQSMRGKDFRQIWIFHRNIPSCSRSLPSLLHLLLAVGETSSLIIIIVIVVRGHGGHHIASAAPADWHL